MPFKGADGNTRPDSAVGASGVQYFGLKNRQANGTIQAVLDDGVEFVPPVANTPIAKTLEEVKSHYIEQINQQKAQLELAGFDHNGLHFQSDELSAKRIENSSIAAAAALITSSPFSIDWTAEDNTEVTLDAAGMLALQAAMVSKGHQLHLDAKAIKASIEAAATVEEITGYLDETDTWVNGAAHWQEYHDTFSTGM